MVGTGDLTSQAYLQVYGLMAVMGVIHHPRHPGARLARDPRLLLAPGRTSLVEDGHLPDHRLRRSGDRPLPALPERRIPRSGYGYAKILEPIDAGVFVIGLLTALWLKRGDRAKYDTIGRLVYEGV
ncbi:MAG: hypothetical protein ICV71_03345 [Thermoleophilia bacterium]|nr:hypothetical protein [Thermoleophilia bacterium]